MIPPKSGGELPATSTPQEDGSMSEKEKMLAGQAYLASDPELVGDRVQARRLLKQFNQDLDYEDSEGRLAVLRQLLGSFDEDHPPFLEPRLMCDYGYNIHLGRDFYSNFDCVFLDITSITFGDRVLLGPGVHIYAVNHPLDPEERKGTAGVEMGRPVTVGNDVWIGGGAIVCPGVTIGEGSTVAAGAVVVKDVEPFTVVGGNPARLIRRLARPEQQQQQQQQDGAA